MHSSSAKTHALALTFAMCLMAAAQAQTTWYVDDDGDEANGCTSWADACPELQTALSLASPGDQIWAAQGTYTPSEQPDPKDPRTATFQLQSGVAIYGGFDGTEGTLEDRAGLFDQTILTGDLTGDDAPVPCGRDPADCYPFGGLCIDGFCVIEQNNGENAYHVTTGSATDVSAILDGFTITAGNADGVPADLLSRLARSSPQSPHTLSRVTDSLGCLRSRLAARLVVGRKHLMRQQGYLSLIRFDLGSMFSALERGAPRTQRDCPTALPSRRGPQPKAQALLSQAPVHFARGSRA